jgi:sarcosine oxidase subunit delta
MNSPPPRLQVCKKLYAAAQLSTHFLGAGPWLYPRASEICCFHCGERNELEFTYGGAARIRLLPSRPTQVDWAAHWRYGEDREGVDFERWCHTFGCGEWFHIARDVRTLEIRSVFPIRGLPSSPAAATHDDSGR